MIFKQRSGNLFLTCLLLFLLSVLILPECVKAEKVYILGVPELFPPHYLLDSNGNPKGFAIDTFNLVAGKAGIQFEYKQFKTWPDIFDAVRDGRVDLIPDIGVSDARRSFLLFSRPLETFGIGFFVRSSDVATRDIDDLYGKRIALVKKNVAVKLVQSSGKYITLVFDSNEEALFALLTGDVDALCYPIPITMGMVEKAGISEKIRQVGTPIMEVKRAIGVSKANISLYKVLDQILADVVHSEEYKKIYLRWHGTPASFWTVMRVGTFSVAGLIAVVVIMLYWRYRFMRSNNRKLGETISELNDTKAALEKSNEGLEFSVSERTEKLLESQVRLQLATESTMTGIWEWNISTNTVYYSKIWKALIGYDESEIENDFYEWESRLHPEDKQSSLDDLYLFIEKPEQFGGRLDYEFRMKHKDGSYRWMMSRSHAYYDDNGDILRMVGCHMDITKMKEDEAFYRQFVAHFPGIVFKRDSEFNYSYILGQVFNITGYTSEEVISGDVSWPEIIYKEDKEQYLHEDDHFHMSEESVLEHSFRIVRKDGDIRFLKRFIEKNGFNQQDYSGFILDVTQEKEFEKMFLQMQKMNAVGKLAGGVAHDFNNILTGVFGYLEILKRLNISSSGVYEECLDGLDLTIGKASALVKQLLAFSRNQQMDLESVDVNRAIRELQGLISKVVPKDIQLQLDLTDDIGTIYADQSQLDQVVLNLVINGKDAILEKSDAFEKEIRISTSAIELTADLSKSLRSLENIYITPGHYVVISVVDTGVGIDKEVQHRIFEPFYTTKEKGKGTGLGLSAVYGIIKQNKGWVVIDSNKGFGTTFDIYWPTKVRQTSPIGSAQKEVYEGLFHGTGTILIASGESSIRKVIGMHVKSLGFDVIEAENEAEVLCHIGADGSKVDVVVLDHIKMSDGFSNWLDEVLLINPNLSLMTSFYYEGMAEVIEERVHWTVLEKPFTIEKLASTLQKALDEHY